MQEGRRERRKREQKGRMELGMQGFVAQAIDMYRRGFDARRMLLQVCLISSMHYACMHCRIPVGR